MRWMTPYAFALAFLSGCYSPDYSSKPCNDSLGCPSGYFCDTGRASAGALGTCSLGSGTGMDAGSSGGDMAAADMASMITLPEYILPAGTFTLGSNQGDLVGSNDAPAYSRSMSSICVQENEVTVAAYTLCVQAGKCTAPLGKVAGCNYGDSARLYHPINCVEFTQAQAFCAWVNRRLPTESEWEYAANGATMSMGEKYPWMGTGGGGTSVAAKACFSNSGTCAIGSKVRTYLGAEVPKESPGFYDFAGNVWEWTTSEFCPYLSTMQDRQCASPARVVRGGSGFDTDGRILRSTVRLGNAKDTASRDATFINSWHQNAGFRCFGTPTGGGSCGP